MPSSCELGISLITFFFFIRKGNVVSSYLNVGFNILAEMVRADSLVLLDFEVRKKLQMLSNSSTVLSWILTGLLVRFVICLTSFYALIVIVLLSYLLIRTIMINHFLIDFEIMINLNLSNL